MKAQWHVAKQQQYILRNGSSGESVIVQTSMKVIIQTWMASPMTLLSYTLYTVTDVSSTVHWSMVTQIIWLYTWDTEVDHRKVSEEIVFSITGETARERTSDVYQVVKILGHQIKELSYSLEMMRANRRGSKWNLEESHVVLWRECQSRGMENNQQSIAGREKEHPASRDIWKIKIFNTWN